MNPSNEGGNLIVKTIGGDDLADVFKKLCY